MENKHNFTGIIISVVVAVILLTVLPILNNMSTDCPPCAECPSCEECPSYNIGQLNINPVFSSGDYNADIGSYDYIDSVTITKDEDLIPENIKKDVNIFGVVGTYQIQLPTLYTPTISISDDTLTITPNSNNGAFVTGYKIYVDDVLDVLLDTTTSTTYDLSNELTEIGTYEIYVTAFATGFINSANSNIDEYVIEPEPVSKAFKVGDILPTTTQLKISWTSNGWSTNDGHAFYTDCDNLVIKTDNNNYRFINYNRVNKSGDFGFLGDEYEVIYKIFGGDEINDGYGEWYGSYGVDKFCIIDISTLTEAQRTVSFYTTPSFNNYFWEDLNA